MHSKAEKRSRRVKIAEDKVVVPSNNNAGFYIALAISFVVPFVLYLLTLAPSVTFEDSGEFIAAIHNLGVCHEPGYPLFTMLGKLFTIIIPFGPIAFRTNLSSALYCSVSVVFLTYATVLILEDVFLKTSLWNSLEQNKIRILKYTTALSVGILYGTCSKLWDQAVITGVKGLNSVFEALFLLLATIWQRQENPAKKRRAFYAVSFVLGLTLTNHTTSAALIPLFGFYVLITRPRLLLDRVMVAKAILFFAAGLLPFAYLLIASHFNPVLNWGDPENLTNLIRTITRHQYSTGEGQTAGRFFAELSVYFKEFIVGQWIPFVLLFAAAGLWVLWRLNRKTFLFLLAFLFFTIPVTTYLTDFDVTTTPFASNENKALVSVFYIPSYLVTSVLIGIGLFYLGLIIKWKRHIVPIFVGLALCVACCSIPANYVKNNMSKYHFPQVYIRNMFKIAGPNSLVFSDWDPFSFPFFYYQFVENKRTDIISLDVKLLMRSWYLHNLEGHRFESLIAPSSKEVEEFLRAVKPFEDGQAYNGTFIQQKYEAMIASFIDTAVKQGKEVYFTFMPQEPYLRDYKLESVFAAYKVVKKDQPLTDVKYEDFDFSDYIDDHVHHDRMANYVKDYYGNTVLSRAYLLETTGRTNDAVDLYQKGLLFEKNNPQVVDAIQYRLNNLASIGMKK